jgi:hypothetical protein
MQILNRKQLLGRSRPTRSANRIVSVSPSPAVVTCRNWKAFGPTQDHADGDAEYFRLTNQLNQQHEWFAPRPDVSDDDAMEVGPSDSSSTLLQDKRQRPEYGLSMKQISALGLTGNQARLPDPVRHKNTYNVFRSLISKREACFFIRTGYLILKKLLTRREIPP